jgi:hypothetical protein
VFDRLLPDPNADGEGEDAVFGVYKPIVDHFNAGKRVELCDTATTEQTAKTLNAVAGLDKLARKHIPMDKPDRELPSAMEFVLEGLHQSKMVGKDDLEGQVNYYDMLGDMMAEFEEKGK